MSWKSHGNSLLDFCRNPDLTSHDIGDRACGGVSVLVRDGIPSSECTLNTSLQAKAVTISTSKTITICSLYLPPSDNLNIVLLTRLIDQLPTPFVICGDFNGHSVTWGCDKNNSRGVRIDDFITDYNVCLLNDALPRWNFNRADWVQFDHLCKEQLTLDIIELYAEPIVLFTNILCSIAKSCMSRTTAKQKKHCKPWFNTECKDALKARKSALVRFKTNITTDNLSNFRIARAKARRACREKINVPAGNNMCPG